MDHRMANDSQKLQHRGFVSTLLQWIDAHILELGRELRLSYLPPLMIYLAAGISGLTAIVSTFFVKDYLGLSAEFLAMLVSGRDWCGPSRCRWGIWSICCGAGKPPSSSWVQG
jgi:hypothetical protein